MGCLKLTYRYDFSALKVVCWWIQINEKCCAGVDRYGINSKARVSLTEMTTILLEKEARQAKGKDLKNTISSFDYTLNNEYFYYAKDGVLDLSKENKVDIKRIKLDGSGKERLSIVDTDSDPSTYEAIKVARDFGMTNLLRGVSGKLYMNYDYNGNATVLEISDVENVDATAATSRSIAMESDAAIGLPAQGYMVDEYYVREPYVIPPYSRLVGLKSYELKDHLGNVRAVVSDERVVTDITADGDDYIITAETDVQSFTDFYAFGMTMPGRSFNSNSYRYGFNGMEKDDELKGDGNSYDFGARMLDPRIGRWFKMDSQSDNYPYISPYSYSLNTPIQASDPNGEYAIWVHYQITYDAFIALGYDERTADYVAHMASTYADNPPDDVISFSVWFSGNERLRKRNDFDYEITKDSQDDKHVHWHSMMSDAEANEGMSPLDASYRGLQFGWGLLFKQIGDGINGTELGQAQHAFQDADAHFGASINDHLGTNLSAIWFLGNDAGMKGGSQLTGSKSITNSSIIIMEILNGTFVNVNENTTLRLFGTTNEQKQILNEKLNKGGFELGEGELMEYGEGEHQILEWRYRVVKKTS